METIKISNLSKKYGKIYGIRNIDLSINEGEIFGFIGPNGAGKSTTIRTILNLLHPCEGSATILGMDCQKDYNKILYEVGYLPSELFYYDNMRAIKLLKYSEQFYKKDCSKKREELAKILNVDLHKKINDMSFGTKKKIGIIDALQHEPKIIILDEPTTGLDPLVQKRFFELLEIEKAKGATIIYSSHVLGEVQKICDRTAIIKEGKVIQIEAIKNINESNFKRVTILSTSKIDVALEGATDIVSSEHHTTFLYKGRAKEIIELLAHNDVTDFKVEEPDLEEIFMHYYE